MASPRKDEKILVSACLAGVNCTFRGTNNRTDKIKNIAKSGSLLPLCPELLGGLGVPRDNIEIIGGDGFDLLEGHARAVSSSGRDVTDNIIAGSRRILDQVKKYKIREAILKSNSPSCGAGYIYDGTFTKKLKPGYGVLAALLKRNGVSVKTEKEA